MKKYFLLLLCILSTYNLSAGITDNQQFTKDTFQAVDLSIKSYLVKTPLIFLPTISKMTGKKVYLKDEARQKGNSFKTRGVTFEVFETLHEIISKNPDALKAGIQLVTQTDGNHGISLILAITSAIDKYSKDFPQFAADIKKIEPVIFTYKHVLTVKREAMDQALSEYRNAVQNEGQGHIYDTYKDYGDAREAREKYIAESNGKAMYMEHGGVKTMHGHGVAAMEILQQLEACGVNKDERVCLLLPIGAGGPIGLAAAFKAFRPNATAAMIQTPRYDAFIRSFRSGKMEVNNSSLSPYTINIGNKAVVYEDGISVDGPESKEALDYALKYLDDALYSCPKKALELSSVILRDVDNYYKTINKSLGIVGGTTAITAEAVFSNAEAKCIKDAQVIVLFGTEGSIDPDIASYTRKQLKKIGRDYDYN